MIGLALLHLTFAHQAAGMVVSDSQIASDVGAKIMRQGGNAIDAAVATGFALTVTLPAAGNVGGGGFMVVRMADGREIAIDYRETAPALATRNMYLDKAGNPTKDSLIGYRAAGVPGTVAGFWEAHKAYGKLAWKDVVAPAVELAKNGFKLPAGLAASLKSAAKQFEAFPSSYRQFNRNGEFYLEGDLWQQRDLGETLGRIRTDGSKGFYSGKTAQLIQATMLANGGLLRVSDLAAYKPVLRKPLHGSFRGYEISTMPPPSSGGIAMLQMLGMFEGDDLNALGWNQPPYLHLLVESMKRAFADRAEHLGDPGFALVPTEQLLNKSYLSDLRKTIGDRATVSRVIKAYGGREREETTHFSVVDADGNAVANTYTLNGGYGSFATVDGAGFLLNNEMDDFAAAPGKPNGYGLIQGEKNAIQPGKRPLSSMTPTIVTKDGKLVMVLGSPGGPTIINTVMQTILNVLVFEKTPAQAVAAPRFHHQWMPDEIRWERNGLPNSVRESLESKGHVFAKSGGSMGSCHLILIDPLTGERRAGVDPRNSTSGMASTSEN
ncbi:MAG: gamma-glutamyltransferase [Fimbriimonadaceae bacterium]